jgi:replicative DNA helicase
MESRLPPQDIEAEQALLSACISGYIQEEIFDFLSPDDFYRKSHNVIFKAIKTLHAKKQPIDFVTVVHELKSNGELEHSGGVDHIIRILDFPLAVNPVQYAKIIKTMATARRLVFASYKCADEAYSITVDNIQEVLDGIQHKVMAIEQPDGTSESSTPISHVVSKNLDRYELAAKNNGVTGIPTGLADLDRILGGLQPADLIILAARPSMGKSALAMNITERCGKPVLVFSMEMPEEQLGDRSLAGASKINLSRLRMGRLSHTDWNDLSIAAEKISALPVFIDDSPALHYSEIRRRSRLAFKKHGIQLVVIDYLQLMRGDSGKGNREAEIASISRAMKALAKELSIPVLVLAQLNRELEKRNDKRPMLSDLRESGSQEQDADVVLFIYRDEIYNKSDNNSNRGTAEIIVAKHRNGPVGFVRVTFNSETTTFRNITREK